MRKVPDVNGSSPWQRERRQRKSSRRRSKMTSKFRSRITLLLVAGLSLVAIQATAASARPVAGNQIALSETCELPREVLKNEPGLCSHVDATPEVASVISDEEFASNLYGFKLAQEGIVDRDDEFVSNLYGFKLAQEGIVDRGQSASVPSAPSAAGEFDEGEIVPLTALVLLAGLGVVVIMRTQRSRNPV
jgi:hypothetical protein